MKNNIQMSFFNTFENKRKTKKVQKEEPYLMMSSSFLNLKVNNYVRLRNNTTHYITEIIKPQAVYEGFEYKKNRFGERYKKDIFVMRERAECYEYIDGKDKRIIIRQEDVVAQSLFLIDLIFKNDYIRTKKCGILIVDHKEIGKKIKIEQYTNEKVAKKIYKDISTTYVITKPKKRMLYEDDILGLYQDNYQFLHNYLDEGMQINCENIGWATVLKVFHNKVWCEKNSTKNRYFVYFNQIKDE